MTLVELMVGMAVGLAMVATTIYFLVGFGVDNRRMMLEARLSQDMRAAMDIVTRDLRRAGYWQNAQAGAWYYGGTSAPLSYDATGFAAVAPASSASAGVSYSYSKAASNAATPSDQFGVALFGDVLKMRIGTSGYQDLTDPTTTKVTGFTVTPTVTTLPISCIKPCGASCPSVQVREYAITLTAEAVGVPASSVQRTLRSNVRLRNDHTVGSCPV